jgi:two-component system nitrogen regulation response regulator GlnG
MEQSDSLTILIVDPELDFLEWADSQLRTPTTRVITTTDAEEAFQVYCSEQVDLLLADTHSTPVGGQELLKRVRQRDPNAVVVLTSSFSTNQSVIESMRLGAFDFIRKESLPFSFKMVVDSALKARSEMKAATEFKPQLTVEQHRDSIVGKSDAMQQVFKLIGRVAHTDAPVMITGESGTGKELIARAIHQYSLRNQKDFVAINCAAIPENLLESELFGHEKGAFTGAVSQRIGRFEQSNGGTLFLDEIGDLPLAVQGKLLRVLQDGEFSRVGGNINIKTDVRIIAATNKNLEQEVTAKLFREDLFYRLNVVRIQLPPVRQRIEDIRLLAEYFLQKISAQKHLPRLRLSEEAARVLETHQWPGNVRELENTLQRAVVLSTGDVLLPKDIPIGVILPVESAPVRSGEEGENIAGTSPAAGVPSNGFGSSSFSRDSAVEYLLNAAMEDSTLELLPWVERQFTLMAMQRTRGNQIKAAKLLGISRATLRKRLERFMSGKSDDSDLDAAD